MCRGFLRGAVCVAALLLLLCVLPLTMLRAAGKGPDIAVTELPGLWSSGTPPTAWAQDELYVLEFWATWCAPCRAAMPHMEELWQRLQSKGVHVIGINVWEKRSPQEITDFLAKQKVPPTYPIALARSNALTSKLNINGIPNTAVLRNGSVLWQGHPAELTESMLLAMREGKDPNAVKKEEPKAEPEDPFAVLIAKEQEADKAALAGDWAEAVRLETEAILAHPLQKRLTKPYIPETTPERRSLRIADDAGLPAIAGDAAAPYAALLGRPLPKADDALTVVSLWRFPWWVATINHETAMFLPGAGEDAFFGAPFRLYTVTDAARERQAIRFLQQVPFDLPKLTYVPNPDKDLFGFIDRCNYPFVAIFVGEELVWRGALELAPRVFAGPLKSADEYRAAIEKDRAEGEAEFARFKALREAEGAECERLLKELREDLPMGGYASLFMQYLFTVPFEKRDTDAGLQLLRRLETAYADNRSALEMLLKVCQSWPELDDVSGAERSRVAERLAELCARASTPGCTEAWYVYAADVANASGDRERETAMVRKALEASPAAVRLMDFRAKRRSLPSR